jgi:glutaredoxin 3
MSNVTIYTKFGCSYCVAAKTLLTKKGVAFEEVNLDGKPDVAKALFARVNRRTVPQIFIGGTHVGGCDDLYALEHENRLDGMLSA